MERSSPSGCARQDCVHVFQAFLFLEASRKAFLSQRTFVKHTLPRIRRKAAEAAAARAVTSTAAFPDLETDEAPSLDAAATGSTSLSSLSSSFDFTEVDREVAADAHEVDQSGRAEEASLPATPQSSVDENDLRPEWEELEEDESLSDNGDSGGSRESPSSGGTPVRGSPNLGSSTPPPRSAREVEDEDMQTPTLPSRADFSQAAQSSRPRLRTYASARDLGMSSTVDTVATSEPASKVSSPNSRRRSATVAMPNSRSAGSSPRHSLVSLSPRSSTMSDHARRMHARTNSHPEIQALLKRLMEAEEEDAAAAGQLKTRVWGTDRSGPTTPNQQPFVAEANPFEMEVDEVLSQDG